MSRPPVLSRVPVAGEAALVTRHRPLVRQIARKAAKRSRGFTVEELEAQGLFGLLLAIRAFNPERGAELGAYARSRITGEILDFVREETPGPRGRPVRVQSLEDLRPDMDDADGFDPVAPPVDLDQRLAWDELTAWLPWRERCVLDLRFHQGLYLREVGAALGISESRACQLQARALWRLRERLGVEVEVGGGVGVEGMVAA